MRVSVFDQPDPLHGCADLRSYTQRVLELRHPELLPVLDVHVSNDGCWRLITAGLPERLWRIHEVAEAISGHEEACSLVLSLVEAYAYLHRVEFRGGRSFSWEIECLAVTRDDDGTWRMVLVPPSPYDIAHVQTGQFFGNPRFAAPELFTDKTATPTERSDSFSLGAILYQLATGQPHVVGDSVYELMRKIASAAFPPIEQVRPDLAPDLLRIVSAALSREPASRPSLREWTFVMERLGGQSLRLPRESVITVSVAAVAPADSYCRVLGPAAEAVPLSRSIPLGSGAMGSSFSAELVVDETNKDAQQLRDQRAESRDSPRELSPTPTELEAMFSFARQALLSAIARDPRLRDRRIEQLLGELEHRAQAAQAANDVAHWDFVANKLQLVMDELRFDSLGSAANVRSLCLRQVAEIRQRIEERLRNGSITSDQAAHLHRQLDDAVRKAHHVDLGDDLAAKQQLIGICQDEIQAVERAAGVLESDANEAAKLRDDKTETTASGLPPAKVHDNVQFTVYRPKAITPETWHRLLAFAHLDERPPDAPPDELDPKAEVQRQAEQSLGHKIRSYQQATQDSLDKIPHEGELTFVPEMEGVRFDPPQQSIRFLESVNRVEFRMLAGADRDGQTLRGRLSVFLGAILLADVPLRIAVDSRQRETPKPEPLPLRRYRKIFASYSHHDLAIVEQFERFAETLGDRYLRDWKDLRSGERWDRRLLQMIEEADVFQLFWSSHSMRSPYCRREWEHALSLNKEGFIRPTYWENPLPQLEAEGLPPRPLLDLHFTRLARADSGTSASAAVDVLDAARPGTSTSDSTLAANDPAEAPVGDDTIVLDAPDIDSSSGDADTANASDTGIALADEGLDMLGPASVPQLVKAATARTI